MELSVAGKTYRALIYAVRSVLLISAVSLLLSCGSGKPDGSPDQAHLSKPQSSDAQCSDAATIAAGAYHTAGLKKDGTVVAVGYNGLGQLDVSSWTDITAIAAGTYHTVGLKKDGTVVAVGSNGGGRLDVSSWTGITAIAAGAYHTVGLKKDGTAVAVGDSVQGQLKVTEWTGITAIAAGGYHTVGLKKDGTAVAVGSNGYGQLDVSSLFTDMMPLCGPASTRALDVSPPVTTAEILGTLGANGWYVSSVQITLTATDNDGSSAVKELHYSVDGIETVVQGSTASFSLAEDGTHSVTWYAIDRAENAETPQEKEIKIDTTPPSIVFLSADPPVLWPPNHSMIDVLVGGSAYDDGSGVASTIITVADEYGTYNMIVPDFGGDIWLEAWRDGADTDGRVYTITAMTTDSAGNRSFGTTTVLVPHDMNEHATRHRHGHGQRHRHDARSRQQDHRAGRR